MSNKRKLKNVHEWKIRTGLFQYEDVFSLCVGLSIPTIRDRLGLGLGLGLGRTNGSQRSRDLAAMFTSIAWRCFYMLEGRKRPD